MLKLEYYDIINEMQQLLSELKKNHEQNYQNVNTRGKVEKIAYILGGVNEHLTAIHVYIHISNSDLPFCNVLHFYQQTSTVPIQFKKNQNVTIFPLFKNYCSL